ncbi:pyridoxal phosphate-dependent transferase, partial [Thamnocephalis sphaerospora]
MGLPPAVFHLLEQVNATLVEVGTWVEHVPGSAVVLRYVRNSYQNDPFRILLELFLVFFAIRYMIDELITDWEPEALVPALSAGQQQDLARTPVVAGPNGPVARLTDGREMVNMTLLDFMGLLGNEELKETSVQVLRNYGVGACGPPGFYGTLDVHMQLEKDLAAYFGVESAIIYAQGFSAVVSLIPAFSKRGDIIICDEGAAFSVQRGVQLSRSHVRYFRHNDMKDLERVMKEISDEDRKHRRPLTRRFVVTEGISQNYGDI